MIEDCSLESAIFSLSIFLATVPKSSILLLLTALESALPLTVSRGYDVVKFANVGGGLWSLVRVR